MEYNITLALEDGVYVARIKEFPRASARESTIPDALFVISEILEALTDKSVLDLWTIYVSPVDYPGKFVARRFALDQPTSEVILANTLDEVRSLLPQGLTCVGRSIHDEPQIVETWV